MRLGGTYQIARRMAIWGSINRIKSKFPGGENNILKRKKNVLWSVKPSSARGTVFHDFSRNFTCPTQAFRF